MKKAIIITLIALLIAAAVIIIGINIRHSDIPDVVPPTPSTEEATITKSTITEQYFTGSTITLSGTSTLVKTAQAYVTQSVDSFRARANKEVPDMLKQFGPDSSAGHYTIDIGAKLVAGDRTQSIVIDEYLYTGGANGMSTYKVFTADRSDKIIGITDIIEPTQQDAFVAYVKKQLLAWHPDGGQYGVVFPEDIKTLTIKDLGNSSLDDKNLTIYFDKYAIAPGAAGAIAFPLPLKDIGAFLK